MAVQELELENLIAEDKLTQNPEKAKLSSGLTNKYLCYRIDNDASYYESEHQIVIATIEEEKNECNTLLLVIPPNTSEVTLTPKELLVKLGSDTELLKNTDFRHKLIEVVFRQDSFDAVELLLNQNVFSWEGFLRISVRFPLVLKNAFRVKLSDHGFPLDVFADGNTLLHDCVINDCAESVKLILDTLHDKTFQTDKGVTEEILQAFIDKRDRFNMNALFLSVARASQECLIELIKAGADTGLVDINGNSVFHLAGYFDNSRSINTIFSHIEQTDGSIKLRNAMKLLNRLHFPPIILSKSEEITNLYLKYIDLTETFDDRGNYIIHMAAKFNNLPLMKSLVGLGVDLNCTNKDMLTPLKLSASEGFLSIVEVLLGAGVKIEEEGRVGTALFMAGFNGHFKVAKLLIEHGARLYNEERSLLHAAAQRGNTELIEYLLKEQKLDVNALDVEGESPLFKAVHLGCKMCVCILLVNGASPNQVNGKNENILNIAIEKGLVDIVRFLVEYKVDRSYLRFDGMSSLMLACVNDEVEILSLLAEDITLDSILHKDNEGNNLFHILTKNGSIHCTNLVLKQIDFDSIKEILFSERDNEGLALSDIIFRRKREQIKDFLSFGHEAYFLDHPQELHYLFDEGLYDMLVLILDKMVNTDGPRVTVNLKYFDSTSDGLYPGDKGFRYFRKSLFHKMLDCPYEELKYHPVVSLVSKTKLAPYRFISYLQLFYQLLFLLIIAFSLITASYTCEDQLFVYNDPLSFARLATEIMSIVFFVVHAFMKVVQFGSEWRLIYENDQSNTFQDVVEIFWTRESSEFSFFRKKGLGIESKFLKRAYTLDSKTQFFFTTVFSYFKKLYNALDIAILVSVVILIILRIAGNQTHWAFASLTFLLLAISSLNYIRIIPSLGAYIASILTIFAEDIPKFVSVILVVLVGYVGSIHLAGRYEAQLRQADNAVCLNDSSFIYWFNPSDSMNYNLKYPITSGLILLMDGGPNSREDSLISLNAVFLVVYLFFAFLIIVVLLNILIAQLSETYAKISSEREFHFLIYLGVFFELYSPTNALFGRHYRPRSVIDHIKLSKSKWQGYLDKTPNRDGDLLVRDIDTRSKSTNDKIELISDIADGLKKKFVDVTDLLVRIYGGVVEGKSGNFRESKKVEVDATLESVSMRLDGLEEKMEKIIHLLEAK